ncbi:MAG TPA: protein kinase [Polyangiaceae bacterium]|nr:protein kinase [Polyangiaceae bacterium]
MAKPQVQESTTADVSGRILLVDDQPELRRLLQRNLLKAGHTVVTAEDGRAAIALFSEDYFDLVISDIRMPDMDGMTLLRELHALDPDLPVLLITGSPQLHTAMQAVEYGALEYLTKPVPFERLRASALRAIDLRRCRAEAKRALEKMRSGEHGREAPHHQGERELSRSVLLAGRYRIGRPLGAGGMGVVYEATVEDATRQRVALKVLHASLAVDEAFIARFRREAESIGRINHPNIVRLLDFYPQADGFTFLVMERLDGVSLRQAISNEGQLSARRTALIASQVLVALRIVHQAQIIHRDIKPENVFLTDAGNGSELVKVLDFGAAKPLAAAPGETLTSQGVVVGTPTYMSPEHARGGRVDERSDVYSLGAVMYEALTGRPPFAGDSFNALLFAIQEARPVPLDVLRPDLDSGICELVARAMAPDPDQRFQSAVEMASSLELWLEAERARRAQPSRRSPPS